MTKKYLSLFLVLLAIGGVLYWLRTDAPEVTPELKKAAPVVVPATINSPPTIDGKKVLGAEKVEIQDLVVSNTVSSDWEESLEQNLRAQGGLAVKDISIVKEDSFIWVEGGVALNVETVKITISNQKNQKTSFRMMVDAESGKILKNWDHPIIDSTNPDDKVRIKLDPRYYE